MTDRVYDFHTDPGHGWLEVRAADLVALGLSRNDFSTCSYRSNRWNDIFYLEEDCDASKFAEAYEKKYGHRMKTVTIPGGGFIRRLPCIQTGTH